MLIFFCVCSIRARSEKWRGEDLERDNGEWEGDEVERADGKCEIDIRRKMEVGYLSVSFSGVMI